MIEKRRKWFRPRVFLRLLVGLFVVVVGCFVRLLGCVFVCLFVRSFVGWRGGWLCEGLFWLRGEASCHSSETHGVPDSLQLYLWLLLSQEAHPNPF